LGRVQTIGPGEWGSLKVARPRQGTISRWNKASSKLACIVDGKTIEHAWENLSYPLQETVCSEFLRSHNIPELPKLKSLLLPVGGTQEDVDIYGLTTEGKKLFAQVTYSKKHTIPDKITRLSKYHRDGAKLVLFCRCGVREFQGNIHYVPVETDVFNWLESNKHYAALCFSGG
jgi:hypothetical protein